MFLIVSDILVEKIAPDPSGNFIQKVVCHTLTIMMSKLVADWKGQCAAEFLKRGNLQMSKCANVVDDVMNGEVDAIVYLRKQKSIRFQNYPLT